MEHYRRIDCRPSHEHSPSYLEAHLIQKGEKSRLTQRLKGVPVLYHLGLPVVCCHAPGTDVPALFWYGRNLIHLVGRLIVKLLIFCSARDRHGGSTCPT